MKLFKRLATLLLVFVLAICATACDVKFADDNSSNDSSNVEASTPDSSTDDSSTDDSSTDDSSTDDSSTDDSSIDDSSIIGGGNEDVDPDEEVIDGPHMSERTYERIDDVAAYAIIDEIEELCALEGSLDALIEKRDAMFTDYYNKLSTYYTVASINYDLDVTNEYWKTESEWIETFYNEYHNAVLEVEKVVFKSSYADVFIEELGQDYADMILAAEVETEEQLALQARITELESDYMQKANSTTVTATTFANILTELITKRNEYAKTKKNAEGEYYANFMDYAYAEIYGREYTPAQAKKYRTAVKYFLYDVAKAAFTKYSVYDADTTLSPSDIKKYMPQIIENTVPEMLSSWTYMMDRGLYSFDKSSTKANTSYVTSFSEFGDAYMFINATGSFTSDLSTLIHEFGHYNEHFMSKKSLSVDGVSSYDLFETHSQGFELISLPAVKAVCQDERNAGVENLYESYAYNLIFNGLYSILSACVVDEFEYTVYNAPASQLKNKFFNETFSLAWGRYCPFSTSAKYYNIPHIYASPAYYISYSVSMVFSSIIWASNDPINNYVKVVEYGGNNYLSTVAAGVGLNYPMDQTSIYYVAEKYKSALSTNFGVHFE